MKRKPTISIIVSVYNEQDVLELFWQEIHKQLKNINQSYEIIFVNDGSTDRTSAFLNSLPRNNKNVSVIHLSRNYGHEAAMIAGIDQSKGDAIICLDADLQHPPAFIKKMVERFNDGFEIVTMIRKDNQGSSFINKIASKFFYRLINKIAPVTFQVNASDFFLISRRIAEILKNEFRERTRFLRGFIQIMGFRSASIEYIAPGRAGGESKYSVFKLLRFSFATMATFSQLPLHLGIIIGVIFGSISILLGVYSIIIKIIKDVIPGYTTLIVAISFLFAIQFFIIGIIGEYVGLIFSENKKRPLYLVDYIINSTSSKGDKKNRKYDG